ncbi:unnamed protein product [Sphagnum balticum]
MRRELPGESGRTLLEEEDGEEGGYDAKEELEEEQSAELTLNLIGVATAGGFDKNWRDKESNGGANDIDDGEEGEG